MGAYLSEPITDKISSDYNTDRIACGASSMQGWRVSQEDAHNCIIDFDENTSLFAVYDGHGGHEVALYCSQKLPEYLKNSDTYKNGNMNQALVDTYLGFDATIATREVVAELKELAGTKDKENDAVKDEGSEDEENVKNLFEEAKMPLEQVMEKYQNPQIGKIQSSNLKSRKIANASGDAGSSSCSQGPSSSSSSDETNAVSSSSSRLDIVECSSSSSSIDLFSGTSGKPDSSEASQGKETNSSSDGKDKNEKKEVQEKKDVGMKEENENEAKKKAESNEATQKNASSDILNGTEKTELNGDIKNTESETESKVENVSSSTSVENGQVSSPSKKGKALEKSPVKGVDSSEKESSKSTKTFNLREQSRKLSYTSLLIADPESDSEDENDETFRGDISEDDEDDDDEADKNEEEDEEESSSDDFEEDEEEEEDEFIMNMTEEPGSDSGCTAVVALLRGKELYVANAGDSRCIVCRKGKVIEMSFDHKPENEEETQRIVKAGGKVTADGRVNGGLNLSRAIGDHAYKQNKDLSNKEQMITALPDIKTLTINPEEDEFMVLACDGIWNFMSSEDVAEFVGSRLKDGNQKISQICEEMFDHCLAPNTMGDGTGCDNMTAIIVQFKSGLAGSAKRTLSDIDDDSVKSENTSKRAKTEEGKVSVEPTSSKTTA